MRIKLLPGGRAPEYKTAGAAGLDCYAREGGWLSGSSLDSAIYRAKIPLGFALELPPRHVGIIAPRSGLGVNNGVAAGIGACVVDEDYRGEVSALVFNLSVQDFAWAVGDRVCQLLVIPIACVSVDVVEALSNSERGEGGFGSTGSR
jgi:dUTP pyrophosphatase